MSMSPAETATRIIEEIYNQGNLDQIDELYAEEMVREIVPMAPITGRAAMRQYVQELRTAYPDLHIEIEQLLADGDRTAITFVMTGTHQGQSPTVPVPPTGKRVSVRGAIIGHYQDGRGVRETAYHDNLGLMQQLGVIPGPPRG